MPPLSNNQRAAIAGFISITGASDKVAQRFLKNSNYRLHDAVDAYLSSSSGVAAAQEREGKLNQMFDSLAADENEKNSLGVESTMSYLQSIGTVMDDASLFIAIQVIKAPSIGEITRKGYVDGWKAANVDAKPNAHRHHFQQLVNSMPRDRDLFRSVYRYAFVAGREANQKSLSLENALVYWDMLFSTPGQPWVGKIDWLAQWKLFLSEKWARSVNRDMWNQLLEFAFKSLEDETLSFYSEDGAWPGVIDEFVAWHLSRTNMTMDIDK